MHLKKSKIHSVVKQVKLTLNLKLSMKIYVTTSVTDFKVILICILN